MKSLITGGAGFLGSALANRLSAEGHVVYVLDDLSTGDRAQLGDGPRFSRGDVRDVPRLWTLLAGVDVVYHLAARVSVPESILYPVEYNAVNTGGTVSLMAAARDAGVRRVVFTSSGTVYGDQPTQPIAEDAWPRPANPYAVSKLAAEGYVGAIGELYRIETVVLRIFNAYGPRQATPSAHPPVIPHFVRQILSGGSLVLHGVNPGEQTRDFVYVDDVVDSIIRAGKTPGLTGMTFNVGSGRETTLNQVVTTLEQVTHTSARTITSAEHRGGVARMCADISRTVEILEWQPKTTLEEGLRKTAEHAAALRAVRGVAPE